jgi:hypothetical protein
MTELLPILLKISIVIFMAGSLLDLGLRVNLKQALQGLPEVRFVTPSALWAFVLGPALAYALTLVVPLMPPYVMGLILLGLAPWALLLPMTADMDDGRDRQALTSRKRHASFGPRILLVNTVRNGLRTSSCANRRSIAICATIHRGFCRPRRISRTDDTAPVRVHHLATAHTRKRQPHASRYLTRLVAMSERRRAHVHADHVGKNRNGTLERFRDRLQRSFVP